MSSLATVPEPTMVPADSGRVFAACATSWAKSNCMSTPASGAPNHFAIDVGQQRQVQLVARHGLTQLVRGDEHRAEDARLALPAEALRQLRRDQVAQRHVVDQPDQLDMRRGLRRGGAPSARRR